MSAGRRRNAEGRVRPVSAERAIGLLAPLLSPMTASATALLVLTAAMWDLQEAPMCCLAHGSDAAPATQWPSTVD